MCVILPPKWITHQLGRKRPGHPQRSLCLVGGELQKTDLFDDCHQWLTLATFSRGCPWVITATLPGGVWGLRRYPEPVTSYCLFSMKQEVSSELEGRPRFLAWWPLVGWWREWQTRSEEDLEGAGVDVGSFPLTFFFYFYFIFSLFKYRACLPLLSPLQTSLPFYNKK